MSRNQYPFFSQRQAYKRTRTSSIQNEVSEMFDKKFLFCRNNNWSLPDASSWFKAPPWQDKQLDVLKSRLNFHKSQLNDFNIEDWSAHTRRRNPAGEVVWKVRTSINPEFLTQAWTKFYECAFTYELVPETARDEGQMVSMHLCEAPGAFITSLNHYLKLNHRNIEWQWVASTLNPYYEGNSTSNMIIDDRFMFHTLNNWDFGTDNTGNLMNWENSQNIIQRAKSMGKVLLVTADGSIDCLHRPDAQEEVTSALHYCEVITALQALSRGGNLVFKLFTMFEHCTINLLFLINNLFQEVNIYKPVTSKCGNSEVYAVCRNYCGFTQIEPYVEVLKLGFGSDLFNRVALFPKDCIPEDFLKQINECSNYFCDIQCQVIDNNLQAYLVQNYAIFQEVKRLRAIIATEFIQHYELRTLLAEDEILKGILHEEIKLNTNPRYHRGSYTERQLYDTMSLKEKLKSLSRFMTTNLLVDCSIYLNEPVKWLNFYDSSLNTELKFTYGKALDKVNSSKFIFVPIFKLHQNIINEVQFKDVIKRNSCCPITIDNLKERLDVKNSEGLKVIELKVYDGIENYNQYEKLILNNIYNSILACKDGDTIWVQNFPLLTHFSVGIFYLMCKDIFKKIGFTDGNGIILENFVTNQQVNNLKRVVNECAIYREDCKSVLGILPVSLTNAGLFFDFIVFYNNTLYKNKCLKYLSCIKEIV